MTVLLRDIVVDAVAVDHMLTGRGGAVNRVLGGFAGEATKATKRIARQRVQRRTGAYLAGIRSTFALAPPNTLRIEANAAHSAILEQGSRPHIITPRRPGGVLRFQASDGSIVYTRRVNHPGTRPYHILRDGVAEAAKRFGGIARGAGT